MSTAESVNMMAMLGGLEGGRDPRSDDDQVGDDDQSEAAAAALLTTSSTTYKRKRTKRQRLLILPDPVAVAVAPSTTCSSGTIITEEEQDMANCLILLARGPSPRCLPKYSESGDVLVDDIVGGETLQKQQLQGATARKTFSSSRRFADQAAATSSDGKAAGFFVYECKTCSKCFPSFQALGGHRASHKKPKKLPPPPPPAAAPAAAAPVKINNDGLDHANTESMSSYSFPKPTYHNTVVLPNNNNNNDNNNSKLQPNRIHECSICGSEFSSGQALGGHMRRHRPTTYLPADHQPPYDQDKDHDANTKEICRSNVNLSLDLNLPAPSDNEHGDHLANNVFPFASKQPLLLPGSSLVDCHY